MRRLYVYILSNRSRGLYVGVTNDIVRRLREHRRLRRGHTGRYRIGRLVYVETVEGPRAAIAREKQIKGWRRAKKVELIQQRNPAWNDLAEGWGLGSGTADPSRSLP